MKRSVVRGIEVLAILFVALMVVGQLSGQPILLSYVNSGSMEPTLGPGDGFVAVPAQVAGPVETGDVVTFRAEELHGGGLATHRVVGETERGYLTKGDANPFTDQDGGEPPVKDAQVLAVAWSPDGRVLAIPALGTLVTGVQAALETVQTRLAVLLGTRALLGTQGLAYLVFGATLLWYGVETWRDRKAPPDRRNRASETETNVHLILAVLAAVVVVAATTSMLLPAGTQQFGVISAEFDDPGPRVIPTGESETTAYRVPNSGVVPVVVYLEPASEGIDVRDRELGVAGRETLTTELTLSAPPETGFYRRFLVEHRYLALLPRPVIRALYRFHPWAPIVTIDAVLWFAFYLAGAAMLHLGRVPGDPRSPSLRRRFHRGIRRLY